MHTVAPTQIHWMIKSCLPAVLEIERLSFEIPWDEEDFVNAIRCRNCIAFVCEQNNRIVGFMLYRLYKTHMQILNFAVHPEFRHQSIGRQMVEKLIRKIAQHRRPQIFLHVRETNLAAQLFFRRMGFQATSVLHGHYPDVSEDAYVMTYTRPQDDWNR